MEKVNKEKDKGKTKDKARYTLKILIQQMREALKCLPINVNGFNVS